MDCSRPGSSVHEISQARILVCAVLSCFSRVWLCGTLWPIIHQTPLTIGFSRQEYWSELPCPSPGDLSDPGIENAISYISCVHSGFFTTSASGMLLFPSTGDLPNPGTKPASPALQVNSLPTVIAKTPKYPSSFLSSSMKSFRVTWEIIYQASILTKFTEKIVQFCQSTSPNYYLL